MLNNKPPRSVYDGDPRLLKRSVGGAWRRGDDPTLGDQTGYSTYRAVADHKSARSARQRTLRSQRLTRRWHVYLACGLSLVLSFILTLQLTKPTKPGTRAVAALSNAVVSDNLSLMAAVKSAGLRGSPQVKGAIDEMTRLDSERVSIKGWAAKIGSTARPLVVMAFADGKNQLITETSGGHPDLTDILGLSDAETAKNVSFEGTLRCRHNQKMILLAVADDNSYGHFGSRVCP